MFGPVSGAHFNPVVSVADWFLGRRSRQRPVGHRRRLATPPPRSSAAIAGAVLANVMFDLPAVQISDKDRVTAGHLLGEVVATAGLVALIFALARTGRAALSAAAVGAYIGAAYWFTSSTSFANPAVTIGRIFSDTFAGIAPGSVPGIHRRATRRWSVGLGLVAALYPDAARGADNVVVPHDTSLASPPPPPPPTRRSSEDVMTDNASLARHCGETCPSTSNSPGGPGPPGCSSPTCSEWKPSSGTCTPPMTIRRATVPISARYEEFLDDPPACSSTSSPIRDDIERRVRDLLTELASRDRMRRPALRKALHP